MCVCVCVCVCDGEWGARKAGREGQRGKFKKEIKEVMAFLTKHIVKVGEV